MSSSSSGTDPGVPSSQPRSRRDPPTVAGYDLVRVIGQGGMGIVWEAVEHRLDRSVALKLCTGEPRDDHVRQLWSEARLAAKIGHPGVVPVHDFGYTADGRPYYTMDLVSGTDLSALLDDGPLSVPRALALALEMAEAVAAAHERGVLHRDLKPSNILLDGGGRVRILDFGLAVLDTDAFDPRKIAGSPPYMAPERFMQKPPSAAGDVYALGVVLYEMIVGDRPYRATEIHDVMYELLNTQAQPPSARHAGVHPDVDAMVMRAIAKDPANRWPTARGFAEAVRAVIEGRPVDGLSDRRTAAPPSRRAAPPPRFNRADAKTFVEVTLDLHASAAALWPHVANTDRFNKAAGLEQVAFIETPEEGGGARTTGSFRTLGMEVAWNEHPFEWVKDREHSVYREYTAGPLKALWNRVRLAELDSGRTRLIHEVSAIASGVVGRLAAKFELELKLQRRIAEVYMRLDAALAEGPAFTGDPFEPPHTPSSDQRARVADVAERLVERSGFAKDVVTRLADLLLYAPDKQLERLRPWALADGWHAQRDDALDLMLVAANAGLLELAWDLVCPRCQVAHDVAPSLGRVGPRNLCVACNAEYEADLATSVELVFRPHASVRATAASMYCVGAPARRPHVIAQQALAPGEEREISLMLPRGEYRVVCPRAQTPCDVTASPAGFRAELLVDVRDDRVEARPAVVYAGFVVVKMTNATDREQLVRLEAIAPRTDAVTAAAALAHPRFRELFSGELLPFGQHVAVSRAAFVFLDAPGRFGLHDRKGDAGALAVAAKLDALVAEQAALRQGSVVESACDLRTIVAFTTAARALEAAIAIVRAARREPIGVTLRAAVHEGPCIALTRAGRVDWFGETVTRGLSLLDEVEPGGVALSYRVADDRDAIAVLRASDCASEVGDGRSAGSSRRRVVRLATQRE